MAVGQAGSQITSTLLQDNREQASSVFLDSESKVLQTPDIQQSKSVRSVLFQESGCGNNFFNGNHRFSASVSSFAGQSMLEASLDALRFELERLDRFDSVCVVSGLGGGTGSGFGAKILEELVVRYPSVIKTHLCVQPTEIDNGPMQSFNTIQYKIKIIKLVLLNYSESS